MIKFRVKIAGQINNSSKKNVEITVPLWYLSNFKKALEMILISCEINLILTWYTNCIIVSTNNVNQAASNLLSTQGSSKLEQLKSDLKR